MTLATIQLSEFSNLAGPALAGDLRRLYANPENEFLVLFTDVDGDQVAILPVGPRLDFRSLEGLAGVEIEGLRPLCAVRTAHAAGVAATTSAQLEDEWSKLRVRQQDLTQLEEALKQRERYIGECENRMAELGQSLAEREAMLDHREQAIVNREREFFQRSAEAVQALGTPISVRRSKA